jgi:hypothetical protein
MAGRNSQSRDPSRAQNLVISAFIAPAEIRRSKGRRDILPPLLRCRCAAGDRNADRHADDRRKDALAASMSLASGIPDWVILRAPNQRTADGL